jgi:hypothetical protein
VQVAGGNGEQVLSRDVYRLGTQFDFFRLLAWCGCCTVTSAAQEPADHFPVVGLQGCRASAAHSCSYLLTTVSHPEH